jgi:hypothetical protein
MGTQDQGSTPGDDAPALASVSLPDPVPELPGMDFAQQKSSFKQVHAQAAAGEPAAGMPEDDISLADLAGPNLGDDLREAAAVERASMATLPQPSAGKRSARGMS